MVRENLASALTELGARQNDTEKLQQAVDIDHSVLRQLRVEEAPLEWATTQNNLGIALAGIGERESGTARLEESV